ncbi:hypothetical protein WR25_22426 [Diploscapter pachys]|uniref:Uncharacterized protein n=1 Tax=Diploscapter pachys TaxID=2018661 RepID=A0A2A2LUB9_9BILA|nr:hypothetical protein WR25_22426 [Diploscapter pachys]
MVEKRLEDMTDEDVKNSKYYKEGRFEVPISETAGEDLTLHWINQAFGGLMAAIATRKMQHMEEYDKQSHEKCVQDAHELDEHATCIVELLKADNRRRLLRRWKYLSKNKRKSLASSLKTNTEKNLFLRILKDDPRARMYIKRVPQPQSPLRKNVEVDREWVGSFAVHRAKRAVVSRDSYKLSSAMDRHIIIHIHDMLFQRTNFQVTPCWQEVVQEIRKKGEILKERKKMVQAARQKFDQMKKFAAKYQSKIKSVTSKDVAVQPKKPLAMPEIDELEQEIEDSEIKEMLREKKKNMTDQDRLMAMPMKLLRDAVKFGLSISGKNTSDVYKKNIKLISPRMFSIVAEDEEEANKTINVLSPSLFSLHSEGRGIERDASLDKIVGSIGGDLTGQNGKYDQQELLNLVVEATGVAEAVEDAEDWNFQRETEKALHQHPLAQRDYLGPEGQPLYFTRENVSRIYGDKETAKIDIIKKLETTYTPEQVKEMNRTGYVIMTNEQKELFYGPGSPHANPEKLAQLKRLSDAQVRTALMGAVHSIAEGKLKFERRQNDFILSPIVNLPIIANPAAASQALVLSPVVLAALVLSPSIFGSVILSPWLFVAVLSPFVLSPIVLSPVALIPVILSPGVMDPIILSPVLLCPFVLRPFVLSPSVLSPGYVTALVLSPYALRYAYT